MSDNDAGSSGSAKTFTQAELDAVVRDRLARERAKYADYDDLKAKAAEADKSKTQIDKMAEQLESLTKENAEAKREAARRDVADELGLKPGEARRLSGSTYDELLADGKAMVSDLGIDVEARKKGKSGDRGGSDAASGAGDGNGNDDAGNGADESDAGSGEQERGNGRRGRPREMRPGARISAGGDTDENDPLKLIAGVPRRY